MTELFKFIIDLVALIGPFGTILIFAIIVAPYGFAWAMYSIMKNQNKNYNQLICDYSSKFDDLMKTQMETSGLIKEMSATVKGMITELSGRINGIVDIIKVLMVRGDNDE